MICSEHAFSKLSHGKTLYNLYAKTSPNYGKYKKTEKEKYEMKNEPEEKTRTLVWVCKCVCVGEKRVRLCMYNTPKRPQEKKTVFKPNENSSRLENIFFFAHISLHFFVYIFLNTLPGKRGFLFSSTYIRLPLEVCSFTRTVWWILKQSFFYFFHARAICIFFFLLFFH